MELIDNINRTLKDDFIKEIGKGSKLSIAASCFSIYAFEELKAQLKNIQELRFIFTSPTFVTEKANKQKREFYIPRTESLWLGIRNQATQRTFAKGNCQGVCRVDS